MRKKSGQLLVLRKPYSTLNVHRKVCGTCSSDVDLDEVDRYNHVEGTYSKSMRVHWHDSLEWIVGLFRARYLFSQ